MQKSKIVGILLVIVAVLNTVVDIFNGGDFNFSFHINDITTALGGAGIYFLRDAIAKLGIK